MNKEIKQTLEEAINGSNKKALEDAARKKDKIVVLSKSFFGKKTYLQGISILNGTHKKTMLRQQALRVSADMAEKIVADFNGRRLYKLASIESVEVKEPNKEHKIFRGKNGVVDLTALYGAGNEPTGSEYEKLLKETEQAYFDHGFKPTKAKNLSVTRGVR